MLTNDDAIDMLKEMRERLGQLVGEADLLDSRIAFTCGVVLGVICEGLNAYQQDRPMHYTSKEQTHE